VRDPFVQREFPIEEYQVRSRHAVELLKQGGLDALIVTGGYTSSLNYRYLSGHLPRDFQSNFSRPHILLLPRDGEPILIAYVLTAKDAQATSWVKDVRSYTQPFSLEIVRDAIRHLNLQRS
jgi:hypothetical protein